VSRQSCEIQAHGGAGAACLVRAVFFQPLSSTPAKVGLPKTLESPAAVPDQSVGGRVVAAMKGRRRATGFAIAA